MNINRYRVDLIIYEAIAPEACFRPHFVYRGKVVNKTTFF